MLSIGFAELLVIAVIILMVVGPERLPETLRFFSVSLSKLRRYWRGARTDLEKELGLDEVRREIHNAEVIARLEQTKQALNENLNKDPEQKESGVVPLSETSSTSIEKVEQVLDSQLAETSGAEQENTILPPTAQENIASESSESKS